VNALAVDHQSFFMINGIRRTAGFGKIMSRRILATIAAAVALTSAGGAAATVSVGAFDFDDNAFVDSLDASQGNFTAIGNGFPGAITDASATTFVFSWDQAVFLDLAFTDNAAVNGAGADLVIFELGALDPIRLTINGIVRDYMTSFTGFKAASYNLNAVAVDLGDFGVANLGKVTSLRLETPWNESTVASPAVVGALNSGSLVPEPGQWVLMILGFGMVGALMRRRPTSAA
jgi:hypothetical protein